MWDMNFNKMWEKNHEDRLAYNEYNRLRQHRWNPRLNAISREANKLAGGYNIYKKKTRDERLQLRRTAEARLFYEEDNIRKETENEAFLRTIIPPQPYKESTVFKRNRASRPGKDLKKIYNHTCQVAGCGETEVETAHIRQHTLPDSVDNETNMWCLCCNHHNAFDKSRMIVEDDSSFIRYNHDGTVREHGFIVYDDNHKVDITFIRKSREHHVNERQKMD
jgi:predicted restriction endonuclease